MTGFVRYSTLTKQWSTNILPALALLLIFNPIKINAQVLQSERYEFPLFQSEENFEVAAAGEHGLYLYRTLTSAKGDQIQLIKIDTAFKEEWGGYLSIEKNYALMGKRSFHDKLFLLLRYKDYSKNDLFVYVISNKDGSYNRYTIKSFIPFSPTEFQVTEKGVLAGGYFNHIPVVLHFSFATQVSRVLPGLFNESGELTQVRTYPDNTFDVLISARNFQQQRTLWIKSYDPEGNLLRNATLEPEENKHLIFGRSIKTEQNMQIVAGVYGSNRNSEYSRGMFIASIDPSGMQKLRYYNFADLKNFFKYMRAGREQRIKNRIERKKIKGKKIRFNYRFLVHELIPYKDKYILLGEAFYPKYITTDRGSTGFFNPNINSRSIIQNGRIFDGYYYTHAVVMCFDADGNLLWDNSFEINDVRTFTLEQFVKLEVHEDKIALMYVYRNEIRTKIIKDDQVLEGKTSDPIRTLNARDIVKNSSGESKLEYWYNDYLYAYGVHEIVSPGKRGAGKRRVFYINKVNFAR